MKRIKDWIVDYAHLLRGTVIMYRHSAPPKHYLEYRLENKCPIIVIPGITNRWGFMKPLCDFISLKGHPTYIVPKLGFNLADVPSAAKKLEEFIAEMKLKDAVIVAHSKGGLIGKYLLVKRNNREIKGLVAIATPFSGSAMSKLIPYSSFKELTQESELIKELTENKEVNKKIISIYPEFDNHVWAEEGSYLDGALENIKVPISGHHKIIYDKQVWDIVLKSIEKISAT